MNSGGFGYCGHTWNPMVGCGREKLSAGCKNCWAEKMAVRQKYRHSVLEGNHWSGNTIYFQERLHTPSTVKKHAVIAVNFMGDMFHFSEGMRTIHYDFLRSIWDTMFVANQHTYLILTKRPEEMLLFCKWMIEKNRNPFYPWVWFGASASNQHDMERIMPAIEALKELSTVQNDTCNTWLSLEPLLETISLMKYLDFRYEAPAVYKPRPERKLIDQVIIGGESGSRAREMKPECAAVIQAQCLAVGVPVYMKQMSGRDPIPADLDIKQLAWRLQ